MARYIDADLILPEMESKLDMQELYLPIHFQEFIADEIPAADVAPVRHGYWVKEKRDVLIHWHCSACKECYYLDMPNAEYCPHCGAKMDLKEYYENA